MKTIICVDGNYWVEADNVSLVVVTDQGYDLLMCGMHKPEDLPSEDIMSEIVFRDLSGSKED